MFNETPISTAPLNVEHSLNIENCPLPSLLSILTQRELSPFRKSWYVMES
jgi:hypothetical protein